MTLTEHQRASTVVATLCMTHGFHSAPIAARHSPRKLHVVFTQSRPVSDRRTRWRSLTSLANLHLGLLGDLQRIIDLDTEIAHGAFEFGVPEQKLNGAQISGSSIDQRGFRPTQRMRAVSQRIKSDRCDPRCNDSSVLSSRQMR